MPEKRNPNLYTGAAPFYVIGRVAYPPELADRIAAELNLDGSGRLLDVGCGPGSLTLLLADRFAAAVGIDADSGMLQEADRLARAAGVANVEWRQLYAEALPADLGTFRLVTFAQSFHWMDQHRVARAVHGMLTPDGASVHVHATTHRGIETDDQLPLPSPPYPALDELSRRYLGPPPPRFGGPGRSGESEVYRAAGFRGPTSITVSRPVVTRSIEEVIAAHLSLSSSTPHLFGDRLARFLDEARALLLAASPTGKFSEQLREVAADIWWREDGITLRPVTAAPSDLQRLAGLLSATGPAMELRSPLTGTRIGELPTSTEADITAAAERARAAQVRWAARPVEERADLLLAFHDAVLDRRDALVNLVQSGGGKARLSAAEEVLHVALTARYYGRTARRYLHAERGSGIVPMLTRIDRNYVPKGLVGVIAPWNYPLTMAISDGLAALVAGNAVLLKPDQQTPLVALAAVELLHSVGLEPDLWPVVHGEGSVVGPQVIDVSDYACFTGSTATGRKVAAQCAERLIGCSLELGGKNALLVLDDADAETAAEGAVRACFSNAGQLCVAAERIYVAEPVREAFTEAFVRRTQALRLGAALDYDHDMASLINADQLERVSAHVEDARAKGATVLTGGRARPDLGELFYEPTVLSGVTPEMDAFANETFGPVVSLYAVADDDEAVARANASEYGLNGSVWTSDPERGRRVAGRLRCGTVNVNEGFAATFGSLDAPMGGMKSSGLGRRQGREGIHRFVEVQSIGTQAGLPIAPSHGLNPKTFTTVMTGMMRVLKGAGRA